MSRIIVSGAIANKAFNGGAAWTRLSYVLGLQRLGFDVYFVEQIGAAACTNEEGQPASFESSANLSYFRKVMNDFELGNRSTLVFEEGERTDGLSYEQILDLARSTDLLVNISGHLTLAPVKELIRRKAYLDLDPGFTQIWHAEGSAGPRLAGHDCFFTVGENLGRSDCLIPTGNIRWLPTRQPVVLDLWPKCNEPGSQRFTTIASWRGPYGPVDFHGRTYGSKVREFRKFAGIPARVDESFEIALDIHSGDHRDRELLRENCWHLVDPRKVAAEPAAFRSYLQGSGAEFSVAQQMYVETKSGWFSDRTVRYLACGRPALVQDTGFSRNYPVGSGLLSFSTPEEAIAGAKSIAGDYSRHCASARQIAETYFDSRRVLGELIEQIGI